MKKLSGIFPLLIAFMLMLAGCSSGNAEDISSSDEPQPTEQTADTSDSASIAEKTELSETSAVTVSEVSEETSQSDGTIQEDNQIVQTAKSLIGIEFTENGASPETGFDNSGFIYYVLRENGFINCPRLIGEQSVMGANISYDDLKSGDLAFFSADGSEKADFGGIYIGDGQMIYCPMPGQTVKITDISTDYWRNAFYIGVSLS